jgi:hypothetical protein
VQLTSAGQSETLRPITALGGRNDAGQDGGNIGGFCRHFCIAGGRNEGAEPPGMRTVQPSQPVATEASAQRRIRRPTTRLRVYPQYQYEWVPDVYPRYNPGPNAVRDCNATYVQEFRPSGTVIVPRMSCFWRPG